MSMCSRQVSLFTTKVEVENVKVDKRKDASLMSRPFTSYNTKRKERR